VSLGLEYRHSDYGSQTVTLPTNNVLVSVPVYTGPAGVTTTGAFPPRVTFGPTRLSYSDDLVTVRLNFHF
jgi:hypothetical protein